MKSGDVFFGVFFFIGNDKCGLERFKHLKIQLLGTTNSCFRFPPLLRVDTKLGDAHHFLLKAQGPEVFSQGRHQRNDPHGSLSHCRNDVVARYNMEFPITEFNEYCRNVLGNQFAKLFDTCVLLNNRKSWIHYC